MSTEVSDEVVALQRAPGVDPLAHSDRQPDPHRRRPRRGYHRQGERVGVVVVRAARMVDDCLAARPGPALQQPQLAGELRVVEELDPPLGEEWLRLEVGGRLVERVASSQ